MTQEVQKRVRAAAGELVRRLEAAGGDESSVHASIDACLSRLGELGLAGTDLRLASSELWNLAGHLLARGWLQTRARAKPRGYAGDHELISWIYERRVCDDPLGRLFDSYFQAQAAPQAVRNRMAMMTDWIVEAARARGSGELHIAVVGSAAGLEIAAALRRLPAHNLRVTLLDLDPAAIEQAQTLLGPRLGGERLVAQAANLFRLPQRPRMGEPLEGADVIFCPGLFDYLDDEAASRMLGALYEPLAAGGRLVVFQFAPHNPTRAYMEWFGDWFLIYRTGEQLSRVLEQARLGESECELGAEALGVDLFLSVVKRTE